MVLNFTFIMGLPFKERIVLILAVISHIMAKAVLIPSLGDVILWIVTQLITRRKYDGIKIILLSPFRTFLS